MARKVDQAASARLSRLAKRLRDLETEPYSPLVIAPLMNGWTPYGNGSEPPTYWQSVEGLVYLWGMAKGGLIGSPMFQLPVGLRPVAMHTYAGIANGALAQIEVFPDGYVTVRTGSNIWVTLSGIVIRTW